MKQESVSGLVTGTGRVTVRAIAAETGLSIATISRVLNGGGNVASDTRERVREVVERLGDRAPEPRRRPPARATRPPVFVRCPYLLTDYFGHIVTSIAETLALHGQSMLLDAGDAVVRSTAVRELPRRRDAYGAVLILPPEPRADLEALVARGYPFVVVDPRTAVPPGMVSVSAAHFSGARAVTRHLIELGHRRIGVITGPPHWHTRDDRVGGHLAALAEAGVLGDPELMRLRRARHQDGGVGRRGAAGPAAAADRRGLFQRQGRGGGDGDGRGARAAGTRGPVRRRASTTSTSAGPPRPGSPPSASRCRRWAAPPSRC